MRRRLLGPCYVTLFLTALLLFACDDGGDAADGGASTSNPAVPLLSDEAFADSYAAFGEVAEQARGGDVNGAEQTFLRQAHDITHVIDTELLADPANEPVRQALYNAVLNIEVELFGARRADVVATSSEAAQGALADAAEALGYQRPE